MTDSVAGRFRIVEQVGSGAMGIVYRALDERTGRAVALKLLAGRSEIEIERARREAQVLAKLAHPAIVSHVDDGLTAEGQMYLAMEWLPGNTLAERLESTGFTLRESVEILRQTAAALQAAHESGVLHRDIKPSNILLGEGDRVTLIDFGIARLSDSLTSITRTGLAIGTPGYMSPEQARGDRTIGPATDVFALACVFYACATGQPAFSGSNVAAVLVKILMANPTPLPQLVPEAPAKLVELVDRMFGKDVASRTPDCTTIVRTLERIGGIPAGPRRGGKHLQSPTITSIEPAEPAVHCIVIAAQGSLDDLLEPPTDAQRAELDRVVARHGGSLEVCANGSVAVHVHGEPRDAMARSAACALEVRRILVGWSVAVSSQNADAARAVDAGAALLAVTVMADIFGDSRGVALDASAARLLGDAFEIEQDGERVTLLGHRVP